MDLLISQTQGDNYKNWKFSTLLKQYNEAIGEIESKIWNREGQT
jgi:hypothetical protein